MSAVVVELRRRAPVAREPEWFDVVYACATLPKGEAAVNITREAVAEHMGVEACVIRKLFRSDRELLETLMRQLWAMADSL